MSGSVLVAEDDALIGAFVDKGLQAAGYSTRIAADGVEAERLASSNEFDVLVLDMALPRRSGFEVLSALRARGSVLPVVVLTGRPELKDAVAALGVAGDDFLTKPFHFPELLARVRAHTRTRGTAPALVGSGGSETGLSGSPNPPSEHPSDLRRGER